MTKQDYIEELKEAKAEAEEGDGPICKGQALALDYAIDLAKGLRLHVPYRTSASVQVSLTKEQADRLMSLLGDGPLDRLIMAKITRGVNELWTKQR